MFGLSVKTFNHKLSCYGTLHTIPDCHRQTGRQPKRHLLDWIEQCFTSPPTQYRLYGRWFLQVKRPNQQYQSTEGTPFDWKYCAKAWHCTGINRPKVVSSWQCTWNSNMQFNYQKANRTKFITHFIENIRTIGWRQHNDAFFCVDAIHLN